MALTPPPATPQRGDRTTFSDRVDAFLRWLVNLVGELNAFVAGLNLIAAGGGYSIPYTVDLSSTSDADPTPGFLRFNAAAQSSATMIYLDLIGADLIDYTSILDQMDASTSLVKGQLRIVKMTDASKFLTYNVMARTTATGYRKLTLVNTGGSAASPFVAGDGVLLQFTRTGDKGDTGLSTTSAKLSDRRASGASAGTNTGNTETRTLNTVEYNSIPGLSLASNVITVPAGTYDVWGRVPAYKVSFHRASLFNITDNLTYLGSNSLSDTADSTQTDSIITTRLTISAAKTFRIQHYTFTSASNGLGFPIGNGAQEVYSEIIFTKVG